MILNKLITYRYFILIVMAGICISCKHGQTSHFTKKMYVRSQIQLLVDSMTSYNRVDGPAVGIAGVKSEQWKRYELLSAKAMNHELKSLTNHNNAVVRCYAFDALVNRNDTAAYSILIKHLTDTAKVYSMIGCIGQSDMVGDWYLSHVIPNKPLLKAFSLNDKQIATIDGILLNRKGILLKAKGRLAKNKR